MKNLVVGVELALGRRGSSAERGEVRFGPLRIYWRLGADLCRACGATNGKGAIMGGDGMLYACPACNLCGQPSCRRPALMATGLCADHSISPDRCVARDTYRLGSERCMGRALPGSVLCAGHARATAPAGTAG